MECFIAGVILLFQRVEVTWVLTISVIYTFPYIEKILQKAKANGKRKMYSTSQTTPTPKKNINAHLLAYASTENKQVFLGLLKGVKINVGGGMR